MSEHFVELRKKLVEDLKRRGILKTPEVIRAMLRVPREEFVPQHLRDMAYVDTPLPIGYGQTISAPHMCAMMNETLELSVGNKVLEVGAGSGYHAALVAEVVAPSDEPPKRWGHVYTVEIVPELVRFARQNLKKTGYSNRVTVIEGDGSKGYPPKAPYDRILVTAAAPTIPQPLIDQLAVGGLMVIPVGTLGFFQVLKLVEKVGEKEVKSKSLCEVAFVPLVGEWGWRV